MREIPSSCHRRKEIWDNCLFAGTGSRVILLICHFTTLFAIGLENKKQKKFSQWSLQDLNSNPSSFFQVIELLGEVVRIKARNLLPAPLKNKSEMFFYFCPHMFTLWKRKILYHIGIMQSLRISYNVNTEIFAMVETLHFILVHELVLKTRVDKVVRLLYGGLHLTFPMFVCLSSPKPPCSVLLLPFNFLLFS